MFWMQVMIRLESLRLDYFFPCNTVQSIVFCNSITAAGRKVIELKVNKVQVFSDKVNTNHKNSDFKWKTNYAVIFCDMVIFAEHDLACFDLTVNTIFYCNFTEYNILPNFKKKKLWSYC